MLATLARPGMGFFWKRQFQRMGVPVQGKVGVTQEFYQGIVRSLVGGEPGSSIYGYGNNRGDGESPPLSSLEHLMACLQCPMMATLSAGPMGRQDGRQFTALWKCLSRLGLSGEGSMTSMRAEFCLAVLPSSVAAHGLI